MTGLADEEVEDSTTTLELPHIPTPTRTSTSPPALVPAFPVTRKPPLQFTESLPIASNNFSYQFNLHPQIHHSAKTNSNQRCPTSLSQRRTRTSTHLTLFRSFNTLLCPPIHHQQ